MFISRVLLAAAATLVLPASEASAHLPKISTYALREAGGAWRLEVFLSTSGMHPRLQTLHGGRELSKIEVKPTKSSSRPRFARGYPSP